MSEPTGARRYGVGGGDAYYDAVKYGGYEGTREQFGRDQAEFAQNAAAVAEAKEAVEQDAEEVRSTKEEFINTIVPNAIDAVQQEGADQVEAVTEKGEEVSQQVEAVGTQWKDEVANEGRARVEAVEQAGTTQVQNVNDAGTTQVGNVNQAGEDQVDAVEQAGADQVQAVTDEGTTQVGNVTGEGNTQVQRVQDKGDEVLNSIPSDYTELTEDVDNLKESINDIKEEAIDIAAGAYVNAEASGAIAIGEDSAGINAEDLVIDIPYSSTPVNGCDVLSAGENFLPMDRCVSAGYNIAIGNVIDLTPTGKKWNGVNGVYTTDGTPGDWDRTYGLCSPLLAKGQSYAIYFANITGSPRVTVYVLDSNNTITRLDNRGNPVPAGHTFGTRRTLTGDECRIVISFVGNSAPISVTTPFIGLPEDDILPYPTEYDVHEYTASWDGEISDFYGGTYDPIKGLIESKYASDGTELASPTSYNVEPLEIATANGNIRVMSSKGSIEKLVYKTGVGNAIDAMREEIGSYDADIANIYTKQLDENRRATAAEWFWFPFDFITGNDYVVKIKFNEFSTTTNRKYSLRLTSAQYASAAYKCGDVIGWLDGTNPEIGKEYVYRFTASVDPSNRKANYICLEFSANGGGDADVQLYSIKAEDALTAVGELSYITATDIVSLNHELPNLIAQGNKPLNRATINPLKLLHFSDIHGNEENLQRLVDLKNSLGTAIDDTICTGDMVANNYSSTAMDFWNNVDGAENVLMVIGNHDVADGEHGYSSDQIGQQVSYETYFSPYISNWGVTMAGTNLTYWYKDYASRKVRLIGLNYLLTGDALSAQNTWLAARLAEAKTADYTVIIAEHTAPSSYTRKDCNFAEIGIGWEFNEFPTSIQDTVKAFTDDGGKFACYIGGHAHRDLLGYNSTYPQQIFINVTTALTTGMGNDQYRANGTKSQDAANIVMVDTVTQTVKLIRVGADMDCYLRGRHLMSFNYSTGDIIAES